LLAQLKGRYTPPHGSKEPANCMAEKNPPTHSDLFEKVYALTKTAADALTQTEEIYQVYYENFVGAGVGVVGGGALCHYGLRYVAPGRGATLLSATFLGLPVAVPVGAAVIVYSSYTLYQAERRKRYYAKGTCLAEGSIA
jgi:hypothetical protein